MYFYSLMSFCCNCRKTQTQEIKNEISPGKQTKVSIEKNLNVVISCKNENCRLKSNSYKKEFFQIIPISFEKAIQSYVIDIEGSEPQVQKDSNHPTNENNLGNRDSQGFYKIFISLQDDKLVDKKHVLAISAKVVSIGKMLEQKKNAEIQIKFISNLNTVKLQILKDTLDLIAGLAGKNPSIQFKVLLFVENRQLNQFVQIAEQVKNSKIQPSAIHVTNQSPEKKIHNQSTQWNPDATQVGPNKNSEK